MDVNSFPQKINYSNNKIKSNKIFDNYEINVIKILSNDLSRKNIAFSKDYFKIS